MRHHPSRRTVLISVLVAAAAAFVAFSATAALAGRPIDRQYGPPLAGSEKPDYRYNIHLPNVTIYVNTSACAGFAAADLYLTGDLFAHYVGWNTIDYGEEQGWAKINVGANVSGHSYRINQRYEYPRQFREYVSGWADTLVERNDGATMKGFSALSTNPILNRIEIDWLSTPVCSPARH